jgi:NAD(P)-dependent dehydrogenase (short-subunit alcohol dehydrogenase family)
VARYDLSGKVALITGGARGIGLGTAQALTKRGAKVVIVDLDQGAVDRAAAEVAPDALGIAADVTDRGAMQQAVATTVERFGGLDIVDANAGIASRGATFRAQSGEAFERVLDVNLMGVYRTVDAALPEIIRRKGHIVVISSVYAFVNGAGELAYAMAKAAVEQFGRGLRMELAQHGASATVAYFGFIDTPMVQQMLDADPIGDRLVAQLPRPLRKRVSPAEAGEAVARGIERRAPRVILPRRWALVSLMRGPFNAIGDRRLEGDADTQALLRDIDAREGETQTSA